jgi:hypothetical protein
MHAFRAQAVRLAAVVAVLAVVATGDARAQGDLPDGLWVGRWVLSPRLSFGYESDSNIFRRDSEEDPEDDRSLQYTGGLQAALPFRMSLFEIDYEASRYQYDNNEFPRDVVQNLSTALHLNFASGDRLILRDQYRLGFERFQDVDPGGELLFEGEPYRFNRWEVEVARDVPDRQGYSVRVARVDFNYEPTPGETGPSFFDYRGFDNSFEYRQPMPGRKWWLLHYGTRRVNNYASSRPDLVGVPFRKEISDRLEAGFRGNLRGGTPYHLQLGWARLDYEGSDASKFRGLSGSASTRFEAGPTVDVELSAARRVLPSSFETYYINNEFRGEFEHAWLPTSVLGGGLVFDQNEYGSFDCNGSDRRDLRYELTGFLGWRVHSIVELRLAALREARSSNCDFIDYDTFVVSTGVRLGWH